MPKHLTVNDTGDFITADIINVPDGVAGLDSTGKVPFEHLPESASGVSSVNGLIGNVTLNAAAVGAVGNGDVGAPNGVAPLDVTSKVPIAKLPSVLVQSVNGYNGPSVSLTAADVSAIPSAQKAAASGVASLDSSTKIPVAQIPTLAYLPTGGGTLTGALVLNANPSAALGAATKQYVDVNFVSSAARLDNTSAPNDQGLLAWTCDPASANDVGQPASGGIRLARIILRRAATVTNIWVHVVTAGATLTAGQNLLGLYTSTGTRVGVTTDRASTWTTTGDKSAALTAPYSAAAGTYYVGILAVGTTIPEFAASSAPATGPVNAGLTVSTGRFLSGPSSQTSMPTSITMASNTMNYTSYWIAVN